MTLLVIFHKGRPATTSTDGNERTLRGPVGTFVEETLLESSIVESNPACGIALRNPIPCIPSSPSKFERLFDSNPIFQELPSLIESRVACAEIRTKSQVGTCRNCVEEQAR